MEAADRSYVFIYLSAGPNGTIIFWGARYDGKGLSRNNGIADIFRVQYLAPRDATQTTGVILTWYTPLPSIFDNRYNGRVPLQRVHLERRGEAVL